MSAGIIILTVLQLLTALATVLIVLFQSGKSAGLSGAIGGVADTFLAQDNYLRNKVIRLTTCIGIRKVKRKPKQE